MRLSIAFMLLLLLGTTTPSTFAQTNSREVVRERLGRVLATAGQRTDVNVAFRQSSKNPFNFVGTMSGLTNADSLEIVVSATKTETIGFRIYPHYKGSYINLDRARDLSGLTRKLLYFSDQNFLFWGADDKGDVFAGFTITLESGIPDDAIVEVLRSIRNTDRFVGELRPFID